jgi:acyl-CoA dehydrogenase
MNAPMDKGLRDDLLKTVDRIAEAECPKAVRESAEAGEWPAKLWRALEETGLTRAALPESAGGAGLAFEDAMLVLRRAAYHALPVPLAETMVAGRLLAAAGMDVPEGSLSITDASNPKRVPWGHQCAHLVVAGADEVGIAAKVTAKAIEKNLAGEPRVYVELPRVSSRKLPQATDRLLAEGALARSVQMAGALERALEYGLAYANERVQFGRPIGKFQAVQHLLALQAAQTAAAAAAVDAAVGASAAAADVFAVSVAKSRAGEAAGRAAEIAHQVHGAMGFTHEHNLHYSTRRLWSWRDEFGNEAYWQARLGREIAAKGADALWPMLTRL